MPETAERTCWHSACTEGPNHSGAHVSDLGEEWTEDETSPIVRVPAAKLTEMANVITEAIAHHERYRELDHEWMAETARRMRALAAGTDD